MKLTSPNKYPRMPFCENIKQLKDAYQRENLSVADVAFALKEYYNYTDEEVNEALFTWRNEPRLKTADDLYRQFELEEALKNR